MKDLLRPLTDTSSLALGSIIRRVSGKKDQQGGYIQSDEEGNLILMNVIDLKKGELVANEGLLRFEDGDELYYYDSSFKRSPRSGDALEVVKGWTLFKQNEALQASILQFVTSSFIPEQVLQWKKEEALSMLFVPIQQKFRIGKYKERRSPDRVCTDSFKLWLDSLQDGDIITYVALILDIKSALPKFFSSGTRPHVVTESNLMEMPYNFKPNMGGHIKGTKPQKGKKHFLVDAGSDHLGRGIKTPLHAAERVAAALEELYRDFVFIPLAGRGAFGKDQSF